MPAAYGFFLFHDDGPHYIYLKDDLFVIGTGPESDWRLPVDGLAEGQGGVVCSVVLRRPRTERTKMLPHLVFGGVLSVQLRSTFIKSGREYALQVGDYVKVPKKVQGNTITDWLSCYSQRPAVLTYGEILPGSVFTQYHFTRILGVGGFGIVHEGLDVVTGCRHAVKVVRKLRCLESGKRGDPVRKEVEILKALNHPYIVTLDNVFQDQHFLFLVMELVEEGSLHDLIVQETRLSESDAKLVILDVCSALTYLHAMAIVHRDIKPGNILIRSRNPLSIKVSDFGLAKIVQGGTDLRTFCGTPDFMAPEMGPLERYDHKVDTWAVGVTLFAMLSGKTPFTGQGDARRVKWRRLPGNTSKLGIQLVCLMLTVNPSQRPAACEIPSHPWFAVIPAVEPSQVAARSTQTTQPSDPSPAQDINKKHVLVALVFLGLTFGFNTWGDLVCRLVAIIVIAKFAQLS